MTTLIFTDVELRRGELDVFDIASEQLKEFIADNKDILADGANLRFSIMHKTEGRRAGKTSNVAALDRLLSAPGVETKWEGGGYVLDFGNKVYKRTGMSPEVGIHLTALEQLALYQVLIMKMSRSLVPLWSQVAHGLRQKFGTDFME